MLSPFNKCTPYSSRYQIELLEKRRLLAAIIIQGVVDDDSFLIDFPNSGTDIRVRDTNSLGTNVVKYQAALTAVPSEGIHIYGYSIRPGGPDDPTHTVSWAGDYTNVDGDSVYGNDSLDITMYANQDSWPTILFDSGDPDDYVKGAPVYADGGADSITITDSATNVPRTWEVGSGSAEWHVGAWGVGSVQGTGIINDMTLTCGSGWDTIQADSGGNLTINSGDGDDSIYANNRDDYTTTTINAGNDGDYVGIRKNFAGTINTEAGYDIVDVTGHAWNETGTVNATIVGGSDDDEINVGAKTGTLYGIGTISWSGTGGGNDTLTVDDSNYDSVHSYSDTTKADTGNDYFSTNGEIATTHLGPLIGYKTYIYYGGNILVKLHMQSANGTGVDVHPTFHAQNVASGGQILYPGSVPAPGGGYDYDDISVDTADLATLHIAPSYGLDHFTIGDGDGTAGAHGLRGANVTFDSTGTSSAPPPIGPLVIKSDGFVTVAVGQGKALKMSSLSIASGGKLDLTNSSAIIANGGSTVRDDVADWIGTGQGDFDVNGIYKWDGNGIVSSTARAQNVVAGTNLLSIGSLLNSNLDDFIGTGNRFSSFGGQAVSATDVLLKYTYVGDCNLDGLVDIDNDVPLFVDGYNGAGASWIHGDFNYDGVVDLDNDFPLLVDGLNDQGAPL